MPAAVRSRPDVADAELGSAVATFLACRRRLFGIAYRMLGSVADAEDLVQDVWLRWQTCDRGVVRDPAAFLAVTTTRLAITVLQSARARHERPVGDWPEHLQSAMADPGQEAERLESLAVGVRLLLVRLSPAERAAIVLREGFGYPYDRIARILHASEAGARQLVSRARRRLTSDRRATVRLIEHRRLLDAIAVASATGEMTALESLLTGPELQARVPTLAERPDRALPVSQPAPGRAPHSSGVTAPMSSRSLSETPRRALHRPTDTRDAPAGDRFHDAGTGRTSPVGARPNRGTREARRRND